jgi:Uma2 family endonuclease
MKTLTPPGKTKLTRKSGTQQATNGKRLIALPTSDTLESKEPQMESTEHWNQSVILTTSLDRYWHDRNDFFIGTNLSVYYLLDHPRKRLFTGPDLFVVRNTDPRPRKSWVVWSEGGRYPDLVIELLSPATEKTDRTKKKALYEQVFRTPEYIWFSVLNKEFKGFRLVGGHYEPIEPDSRGWLWSEVLQLYLGVHEGYLRFFTPEGELVPTPGEAADIEHQKAEIAQQLLEKAQEQLGETQEQLGETQEQLGETQEQLGETQEQLEYERERSEKLAQKLRELGIEPEE